MLPVRQQSKGMWGMGPTRPSQWRGGGEILDYQINGRAVYAVGDRSTVGTGVFRLPREYRRPSNNVVDKIKAR